MTTSLRNGIFTLGWGDSFIGRNGPGSGHEDEFRLQLYWPRFLLVDNLPTEEDKWTYRHAELFISFPTLVRIVRENGYWGFGAEVMGFGFGFDWQEQKIPPGLRQ